MVDPTWGRTCPCGEKVRVNQLGQHHHTDCEYDPLHPGCCDDPSLKRCWYGNPDAGVVCRACGHVWPARDRSVVVSAVASHLIGYLDPWERHEAYQATKRAIEREL